jgi:hypothetical protein
MGDLPIHTHFGLFSGATCPFDWVYLRSYLAIENQNLCSWAKLRSHQAIPFNQNQNLCGWVKLRSLPAIPFNQNQNLCGWANLRSHPAIPFNQNQFLCVVGLTWDPIRRSPLTRTKIYMVGLNWDPIWQTPLTRTRICVFFLMVGFELSSFV